ncbi:UrcA family protein [Sphingomonas panni]|uniref:UrcA family protein n=1 Tax=Sphingomonas panni TaxID=237612 RepID=UPI001F5BBE4A|nr:UrcA family protein [Sphingomonas panni]
MTVRFVVFTATATACLSSVAQAQQREPVSARVSVAGIDLASVEGRHILDARIDRAALRVCQSRAIGLLGRQDELRCRTEMRNDAQVRLAQLTPVKVASAK